MVWAIAVLQAAAIAVTVSVDAFTVSFAYGCKKTKIPMRCLLIINLICTFVIGMSFLVGTVVVQYIPDRFVTGMSFLILLTIGLISLFADPKVTDVNVSKSISLRESVGLAVSLSSDGLAVGLGAAIIGINVYILLLFTLVTGFTALLTGVWLGNKAASKMRYNISWLAGVILIGLAFMQLL